MGEFGFITADGIYHVTVYATDEQGRFRILAMKNYPYEAKPKTYEIMMKPKVAPTTTTTTTTVKPTLPRQKFYNEACSGCFLSNGNDKPKKPEDTAVKTGIRTLSKPLPNAGEAPATSNSGTQPKAVAGIPATGSHTTEQLHFNHNKENNRPVDTPFTHTVHSNVQHTPTPTLSNTQTQTPTQSNFATSQTQTSTLITVATTPTHAVTSAVLQHHPVPQTATKTPTIAAGPRYTQTPTTAGNTGFTQTSSSSATNVLKSDTVAAASDERAPIIADFPITTSSTPLLNTFTSDIVAGPNTAGNTGFTRTSSLSPTNTFKPETVAVPSYTQTPTAAGNTGFTPTSFSTDSNKPTTVTGPRYTQTPTTAGNTNFTPKSFSTNTFTPQTIGSLTAGNTGVTHIPRTSSTNPNKPATVAGPSYTQTPTTAGKTGFTHTQTQIPSSKPQDAANRANAQPRTPTIQPNVMDVIVNKILPSVTGSKGVAVKPTTTNTPSGRSPVNSLIPTGKSAGTNPNPIGKTNSNPQYKPAAGGGSSAVGGDGDLYRFKYILDYHGHTETGKHNGNKEGNYYAIGDDDIERTVEYVANENGFQPRIQWRKLSSPVASKDNTLKDYEFVWFARN